MDVRLEELKEIHKEKQELTLAAQEIEKENFLEKKIFSPKFAEIFASWEEKLKNYKNCPYFYFSYHTSKNKLNLIILLKQKIHFPIFLPKYQSDFF